MFIVTEYAALTVIAVTISTSISDEKPFALMQTTFIGPAAGDCQLRSLNLRGRRGVGDKPMSCKQGVAGSIPSFSLSVG